LTRARATASYNLLAIVWLLAFGAADTGRATEFAALEDMKELIKAARAGGIYVALAILIVVVAAAVPEFRRWDNVVNVLNQSAILSVLAIGQTFVIAAGLIDLSVGQLMGLVAVLISDLMQGRSAMALPAVLLALGVGLGVGIVNGALVNWLRVHPLILTFGMLSVLQGAILLYTDRSIGLVAPEFLILASGTVAGIPVSLQLVATLAVAAGLILDRTRLGWHILAVGAHEENARRAGIDTRVMKLIVYAISGLSAGLAAMLLAGRLGTGYPNAGSGFELDAIVAVVLGGTSLAGGRATIAGTLAAVLILGIASNMLNLLEVPAFGQMVAKGLIVIAAILLTQSRTAVA
jgi:ribose/xylose/arabinose/galactoside ABC-type transport system permease subunit